MLHLFMLPVSGMCGQLGSKTQAGELCVCHLLQWPGSPGKPVVEVVSVAFILKRLMQPQPAASALARRLQSAQQVDHQLLE